MGPGERAVVLFFKRLKESREVAFFYTLGTIFGIGFGRYGSNEGIALVGAALGAAATVIGTQMLTEGAENLQRRRSASTLLEWLKPFYETYNATAAIMLNGGSDQECHKAIFLLRDEAKASIEKLEKVLPFLPAKELELSVRLIDLQHRVVPFVKHTQVLVCQLRMAEIWRGPVEAIKEPLDAAYSCCQRQASSQ